MNEYDMNGDLKSKTWKEIQQDTAHWKEIQQNIFSRWVNHKLSEAESNLEVNELASDLSDGIILAKLCEILTGKKFGRLNKDPKLRSQKLENVFQVLNVFQKDENIKIVSIDSMHIVDKNLKLILGLIWTLIVHYDIAQPTAELIPDGAVKESPKQRLLKWIQSKLPPTVQIKNFTKDWDNGIALGALVDSCLSNGFPEWKDWKPENALENARKAITVAKEGLGIADLIMPNELTNPNVDEQSVITYLSQFLKLPEASQKRNLGHLSANFERELVVGLKAELSVEMGDELLRPELAIYDSYGQSLQPVQINQGNEQNPRKFDFVFTPKTPGKHKVILNAIGSEQSVQFFVGETEFDVIPAPKLSISGDAKVGEVQKIKLEDIVDLTRVEVVIADRDDDITIPPDGFFDGSEGQKTVYCYYVPKMAGSHLINLFIDGHHAPGSPFAFEASENVNNDENSHLDVGIFGPGIIEGVIGKKCLFYFDGRGKAESFDFDINGPVKVKIHFNDTGENDAVVDYLPTSAGNYTMSILSGGIHVKGSPFIVKIVPEEAVPAAQELPMEVELLGLPKECFIGEQIQFYILKNFKANDLNVEIYDPQFAEVECSSNSLKDSFMCSFTPKLIGKHFISIVVDKVAVINWPTVIQVKDPSDSQQIDQELELSRTKEISEEVKNFIKSPYDYTTTPTANGKGIKEFLSDDDNSFTVDIPGVQDPIKCLLAGVLTSKGPAEVVNIHHSGGRRYRVDYRVPPGAEKATVVVKYGEDDIPGSPFYVTEKIADADGHFRP